MNNTDFSEIVINAVGEALKNQVGVTDVISILMAHAAMVAHLNRLPNASDGELTAAAVMFFQEQIRFIRANQKQKPFGARPN